MADPFTPKFVDLVRNYTTTTGTGDFKLSATVNGYTGIATALQVGDCFYYSAIGVDKPAEREVGRGTLLANGFVKRDPISGTKTNFTGGTKSIALIAPAEWYNVVQSGLGGGLRVAATRTELASMTQRQAPVLLAEPGREGAFTFDASNLTTGVTGDAAQGIYVAPASDATGATGAWVRKFEGALRPEWFGAKGDNTTDDKPALQAWLDAGGSLRIGDRCYYCSDHLIVRTLVDLQGVGNADPGTSGDPNMSGTRIRFAAGKGLKIEPQTPVTDPAGNISAIQEGAYNSKISDIALIGAGTGAAVPGVYMRTYAHLDNVNAYSFTGKGFDLSATLTTDGVAEYGNLSNSTLTDCGAYNCGSHGLHIRGSDANTCAISNFTAFGNGGWGIYQQSVIGNLFVKPNIANNALGGITAPGFTSSTFLLPFVEVDAHSNCSLNGNCVVVGSSLNNNGQLTKYSERPELINVAIKGSEPPPTLTSEYGQIFNWDGLSLTGRGSAKDVALYNKNGGLAAYVPTGTTNFNVAGTLTGQGNITAISAYDSTVFGNRFQSGGMNSSWPGVADGYLAMIASATNGCMLGGYGSSYDTALTNRSGTVAAGVVANTTNFAVAGTVSGSNLNTSGFPASVATGTIVGRSAAGTGAASALTTLPTAAMPALTGDVTTASGSLTTTIANNAVTYAKIQQPAAAKLLGNPSGAMANVQEIGLAGGLSFSGTTLTVAALTPTSLASSGTISSSGGGIGYSTGAGGTIVQVTSKSTGVTLNKLCGQITTTSAALAANTGVSFTVTNSQVAATDTIDLVLASGNATAGTYNYQVDKVSAGSFVIWFKNISAGSLAEALTFNFSIKKAVNA